MDIRRLNGTSTDAIKDWSRRDVTINEKLQRFAFQRQNNGVRSKG